jgi:thiamine biosynthesis lipoprotein
VDPRTGYPADHVAGATVVSRSAVVAGALATSLCVLSPDDSQTLVRSVKDAEFVVTHADGRHVESAGWRAIATPPRPSRPAPALVTPLTAAPQGTWSPGWQLAITVELARVNGRRPYLAVWIEDKDRFPVRTLALWYDKVRYLPELRAWYRADRLRSMAEGTQIATTVSSATRSAGKYTLQWDGKDNAGALVKNGTYTVCIEASREHGTYQVARQDMDFSGAAKQVTLPGGSEVNGILLDYHQNSGR